MTARAAQVEEACLAVLRVGGMEAETVERSAWLAVVTSARVVQAKEREVAMVMAAGETERVAGVAVAELAVAVAEVQERAKGLRATMMGPVATRFAPP